MKGIILVGWLLLWHTLYLSGQGLQIDELKRSINQGKDDTAKVLLLVELSEALVRLNPDSALHYLLLANELSNQLNYRKGKLYCSAAEGRWLWATGEYYRAIELLIPLEKEAEAAGDAKLCNNLFGCIADNFRDQGDYVNALLYHKKGEQWASAVFQSACPFCRIFHAVFALDYLYLSQPDTALALIRKGLNYPPDYNFEGWPFFVAGRIYAAHQKYDSALIYLTRSVDLLTKEQNLKDATDAYNHIASIYQIKGLPDSAVYYLKKSLDQAETNKFIKEAMEASFHLARVYETLQADSALYYYKEGLLMKDSVYSGEKQRRILYTQFTEKLRVREIENERIKNRNRVKISALLALLTVLLISGFMLWRNNQIKQDKNRLLVKKNKEIEETLKKLQSTQTQLIQAEKMASLGELTAGIAHEIQNPLNFVNNFAEVNAELADELLEAAQKEQLDEVKNLAQDIKQNQEKIALHGRRADTIVKNMLQHSRSNTGAKEPTDINALCEEYMRISYHGLRAKDTSFYAKYRVELDPAVGLIPLNAQDIGRVILNLLNNAFYAVNQKAKQHIGGYEPQVIIRTLRNPEQVIIRVEDNGGGIPEELKAKIFQPFFTTKPTGEGTGLGLSLAYDIVTKGHGGELNVETEKGAGTTFIISLPS